MLKKSRSIACACLKTSKQNAFQQIHYLIGHTADSEKESEVQMFSKHTERTVRVWNYSKFKDFQQEQKVSVFFSS